MIKTIDTAALAAAGYTVLRHECGEGGCKIVRGEIEELPDAWISANIKKPLDFISVIGHMTDVGEFPSVRECYCVDGEFYFPALNEYHPVDYWMLFPDAKEDKE